jgi:hypothetical protein
MADYNNPLARGRAGTVTDVVDAGLRAYMLRVYNYMLVAMLLTGATAWLTAATPLGQVFVQHVVRNGHDYYGLTMVGLLVAFGTLGFGLYLISRLHAMSAGGAQAGFWAYSSLIGVTLAALVMNYTGESVAQVFFITAAAFGGLSLWGYTTKRDLSGFGSFLIMGAWGLLIALVVNMFLRSSMVMWVASVAGVGIFAGLTAYDTQAIKEMYVANDDGTVAGRKAVGGALMLYLDFINMFQFLLYLMGNRR